MVFYIAHNLHGFSEFQMLNPSFTNLFLLGNSHQILKPFPLSHIEKKQSPNFKFFVSNVQCGRKLRFISCNKENSTVTILIKSTCSTVIQ